MPLDFGLLADGRVVDTRPSVPLVFDKGSWVRFNGTGDGFLDARPITAAEAREIVSTATGSQAPQSTSVDSPEFRASAIGELKDWVRQGHAKLAEGNQIIPSPQPGAGSTNIGTRSGARTHPDRL